MKARILPGWVLGVVLAGGMVASGFARDGGSPSSTSAAAKATGVLPSASAAVPIPDPGVAQAAAESSPAAPAVSGNAADKSLPSNVYASPWLFEVERLSRAGMDEGVILSYVANSAGTFNLTADQIIYLKNQGVSSEVINAMIQHDQELLSGERPMTASAPPALPPAVQAAFAARAQAAAAAPAPAPAAAEVPAPPPAETQIIANDDSGPDWVLVEPDDVPDQPKSLGPVRAPYPVKLSDPIVVLTLPSFTVPCW